MGEMGGNKDRKTCREDWNKSKKERSRQVSQLHCFKVFVKNVRPQLRDETDFVNRPSLTDYYEKAFIPQVFLFMCHCVSYFLPCSPLFHASLYYSVMYCCFYCVPLKSVR